MRKSSKKHLWPLLAVLAAEAALLSLAHWQWRRYQQRLTEQAEAAARPPSQLQGTFTPALAALAQQPNPAAPEESGWRLYGVLQTSHSAVLVNRGYAQPRWQGTAPDFTNLQPPSETITLYGVWAPIPQRKGWLRGPDITTHPQLLAFLNPTLISSATLAPQQFVLTVPETAHSPLLPSEPPVANPQRHLSYMLQWLAMALILPLLALRLRRQS